MSFKIKKPSVIIKANKKRREKREKAIEEKKAKLKEKVLKQQNKEYNKSFIENSPFINNQTFEVVEDDSKFNPIVDDDNIPINNQIIITHEFDGIMLETSCPAHILDDQLVIEEDKCKTIKKENQIQMENDNDNDNDNKDK